MFKVVCFDLDGTLLPMDTEAFVEQYLKELAPFLAPVLSPNKLVPLIWDATRTMIENTDPTRTNEEVFQERFLSRSGFKRDEIWPMFDRFYSEHFPTMKQYVEPGPLGRQVVEAALSGGYRVAVATNPVFPKAAIRERMRWADVDDLVEWVSVYEETHHCKPQPGYYREVAERMGAAPEECLMVGNDLQEDMVAKGVGMKTYLVTDWLIDRGHPVYEPDQRGTMEELLRDLKEKRGLFS
ncbi:HAD family hydrolase [Desmospora profundinema]|uniref:FMN phosphatase YigB (HAD superfamily) n=1 Tax=Desmospora profundinema TaxID=1571184 RepID=A0ABU1IPT8_9BACL|nr:HAD family hydrolase [Desmospora profundinema]MDR6226817.1 FMN phosphatase YigB (HAD superfamily) [Desmospora profundinema]